MKEYRLNRSKYISANQLYFLLILIIPISIILGPAVSLFNILILCLIFITFYLKKENFYVFKKPEIILFLIFYLYLLINSAISVDTSVGLYRNLGFIRFIIFFLAINYFFYTYSKSSKIFTFWSIVFAVFIFDVYFERYTGANILGYGKLEIDGINQPDGNRVVSFFKDEPISGAFISGFVFLLLGFIFSKFRKGNFLKLLSFLILTIFLIAILITGERSNTMKVFIGCFIFLFFIDYIRFRTKLIITLLFIGIFSIIISSLDYIKMRYVGQIYNQLIDKETRTKFYDNLYIQLYKSGYAVYENKPFFGVGNKNYRVETCDEKKIQKNPTYKCTTHPHQIYFELLSEHGIFGTLTILSIIFYLIFKIFNKILLTKNYIQVGAFIYLLINFTPILPSGAFFSDFNLTLFMINFSIMYAINKKTNIFNKN